MAKLFRILSIDGGGIRGIIPGTVLVELEKKLQKKKKSAKIADYFDLIAGTSTGGILTCLLLYPGRNKRPKFSAQDAVNLYLDRGDEIFDRGVWQKMISMWGAADEKYSAVELEDALREYLGDTRLSELVKPCLITAYNIRARKTEFFTQHDAKKSRDKDFLLRDVARATSAAPVFFETANIHSRTGTSYPLIDGGVFANNPTLCAYAEVRNEMKNKPKAADMAILSLGTGVSKEKYLYGKAKNWGALEWIRPLIDIMMSGVSETVDFQLKQIYDAVGKPSQYLRLNADLDAASSQLDNASPSNMKILQDYGREIAERHSKELDDFIKLLT